MITSNIFQIKGNQIKFDNGKVAEFEHPISVIKSLEIDFIVIIFLDVPVKTRYNNNVFAITNTGNLLWQIEIKGEYFHSNNCPFVEVRVNDDGNLFAFNWCSQRLTIEPLTGKVLEQSISM